MVEFDPAVQPEDSWDAPSSMLSFLEKHFNKALSEEERKAILKSFPKPSGDALEVPKLDLQLKEHLKAKGKDPHYGSEKTLYRLQELLLEASGSLACMWSQLLDKEAPPSGEDILLLLQRALVLLGNASHAISQERRKVAWAKVNPKLRSLASEDYYPRTGTSPPRQARNEPHSSPSPWPMCFPFPSSCYTTSYFTRFSSSGRPAWPLSPQLEGGHLSPLGALNSCGLPLGVILPTSTSLPSSLHFPVTTGDGAGVQAPREGGDLPCPGMQGTVCEQDLYGTVPAVQWST